MHARRISPDLTRPLLGPGLPASYDTADQLTPTFVRTACLMYGTSSSPSPRARPGDNSKWSHRAADFLADHGGGAEHVLGADTRRFASHDFHDVAERFVGEVGQLGRDTFG